MAKAPDPVRSVRDAAKYMGISVRTLYKLSAECGTGRGGLPVIHITPGRRGPCWTTRWTMTKRTSRVIEGEDGWSSRSMSSCATAC